MQSKLTKSILFLVLLWTCIFSVNSFAQATKAPLSNDEAFAFSVSRVKSDVAMVNWQIAPGYYLYTNRVRITVDPKTPVDVQLPQGDLKYDASLGRLEVYHGNITVPVVFKTNPQQITLDVDYQGCSQEGFCYPPMHKSMLVNMVNGSVEQMNTPTSSTHSWKSLLTDQNGVKNLLGSQHLGMLLLIFAGLGLLLAFTPCVLPMVPILTGIIVGQKQAVTTKKAFFLSLVYVLGSAITYSIAGLIAATMGSSLQAWLQKPWIIAVVSGLFVLLALSLFGLYDLQVPRRWQNRITGWSNQQQGGTYVGVFLMGMISTLIVSPCVTAPLVGVLMYIGQTGDRILGASALFAMGIGMGIPLILIGMSAGKWLPKSGSWMESVKKIFGVLMLGMAIWLSSRITSQTVTLIFWGVLLLGFALYLGLYLPQLISRPKFARALGLMVGISGVLVIGGVSMPNVVHGLMSKHQTEIAETNSFFVIHDMATLNKQLALAQAAHKPVILDFYADWCESCVTMDRNVFMNPNVQNALSKYVLLRADLTANSEDDQAILKSYDVIAPPTVLFFDGQGREMNTNRIVGEVDAKEFLLRLM